MLVVTGGHPFDEAAFFGMLNAMPGLSWTHERQPRAADLLAAGECEFAAILFYDVPGIRFRRAAPPVLSDPPGALVAGFESLLRRGQPMVFLHHAMAGWPAWDRYAEAIGARFFYQPGNYHGAAHAGSGYAAPMRYRADPLADHPVLRGLEDGFEIEDELYLFSMLEPDIVPLLRSRGPSFVRDEFHWAASALLGKPADREGWDHPAGTDLIAWARRAGNSPLVCIQPGDGPSAYRNPAFALLVQNAIEWVASDQARAWARRG